MTEYHQHSFGISDYQVKRLAKGEKIRIKVENMTGSVPVCLTTLQMKKVERHLKAGKGMDLQLSPKQIAQCVKFGGSIWGSIKDGLKSVGKFGLDKIAIPVATNLFNQRVLPVVTRKVEDLGDRALKKVGMGAKPKRAQKGGFIGSLGGLFGLGVKPKRKVKKVVRGEGFFSDLVSSVGNKALDIGANVGTAILTKKLMGGKVKRKGKGITAPGMPVGRGL